MGEKKYYWLRLKKDFFKRHDIQVVENMPNGKDYVLFYLKLLCESVDHEGNLRFNEEIPYNEEMLSAITNTNVDTVRNAIKLFAGLHMIEVLDDGTLFMTQVEKMIGGETYWAERKREQRLEKKLDNVQLLSNESPTCPSKSKSIDKEQELYIEPYIKSEGKSTRFTPPTLEEVQAYCIERGNNVDAERFINFYSSKGWMVGKNKMKDWKAAVRNWEKRDEVTPTKPAPKQRDVMAELQRLYNEAKGG
jgi:predicted phage replisome organizer